MLLLHSDFHYSTLHFQHSIWHGRPVGTPAIAAGPTRMESIDQRAMNGTRDSLIANLLLIGIRHYGQIPGNARQVQPRSPDICQRAREQAQLLLLPRLLLLSVGGHFSNSTRTCTTRRPIDQQKKFFMINLFEMIFGCPM